MVKKYVVNDIRGTLERLGEDIINNKITKEDAIEIMVNEVAGAFEDVFEILNDLIEVELDE